MRLLLEGRLSTNPKSSALHLKGHSHTHTRVCGRARACTHFSLAIDRVFIFELKPSIKGNGIDFEIEEVESMY